MTPDGGQFYGSPETIGHWPGPGHRALDRGPGANCRAREENTNVMLSVLCQSQPYL